MWWRESGAVGRRGSEVARRPARRPRRRRTLEIFALEDRVRQFEGGGRRLRHHSDRPLPVLALELHTPLDRRPVPALGLRGLDLRVVLVAIACERSTHSKHSTRSTQQHAAHIARTSHAAHITHIARSTHHAHRARSTHHTHIACMGVFHGGADAVSVGGPSRPSLRTPPGGAATRRRATCDRPRCHHIPPPTPMLSHRTTLLRPPAGPSPIRPSRAPSPSLTRALGTQLRRGARGAIIAAGRA